MPQLVTNLLKLSRETENIQIFLQAIVFMKGVEGKKCHPMWRLEIFLLAKDVFETILLPFWLCNLCCAEVLSLHLVMSFGQLKQMYCVLYLPNSNISALLNPFISVCHLFA